MKFDEEKYKPSLIYTSLLKEASKVRMYGIIKYGDKEDWLTTEPERHLDAAIRHIRQHIEGGVIDDDSKCMHLAHAVTNLMFEIERLKRDKIDFSPSKLNVVMERTVCNKCNKGVVLRNRHSVLTCNFCNEVYAK